ncbi:cupin domain-containing protein [Thermodesulfobacteriota bacterium]
MTCLVKNIFKDIPADLPEELVEIISGTSGIRIERIVSRGHSSPEEFWYDQDRNEYVILLKGKAGLVFENRDDITIMQPGDYMIIPAHVRHRVEWTDPEKDTVWLAIHY